MLKFSTLHLTFFIQFYNEI